MIKLLFYDFEVFKFDWMVVIYDMFNHTRHAIVNDPSKLNEIYQANKNNIWVGYNSTHYDQWIKKGILCGFNPKEISDFLISGNHGAYFDRSLNNIQLFNYDAMFDKRLSLKQLEGWMGHSIKESSVPFDIQRPLTPEELKEVEEYCDHDVQETIQVFLNSKKDFDSHLGLIKMFNLPLKYITKTKAQLSAMILGAKKMDHNDEFDITIPNTLRIKKYDHIVDYYRNVTYYKEPIDVDVAGVKHKFGWGGIHGAVNQYISDGFFVSSDVASQHPALIIEYDYLSRNVSNKSKYREIRDDRIKLKAIKDPKQESLKLVLNSTNGAAKDKYNQLYDPVMNNNVCVAAQLTLLDLIEHVEGLIELLVQSNTDGIIVKLRSEDDYPEYIRRCDEWSKRTRLDLEHDIYRKVIQKDVNNYMVITPDNKIKAKGGYVKELKPMDYDLAILNIAVKEYFINGTTPDETIGNNNKLIDYQMIIKCGSKADYLMHGNDRLNEKVIRVFASKNNNDPTIYRMSNSPTKVAGCPEHVYINNGQVIDRRCPRHLDKSWYIREAWDRIHDFQPNQISFTW